MNIDEWMESYKKSHQIKCPYCDYVFEDEEVYPFVSMWGEDSEAETECINCDRTFYIKEDVDRTWETNMNPIE